MRLKKVCQMQKLDSSKSRMTMTGLRMLMSWMAVALGAAGLAELAAKGLDPEEAREELGVEANSPKSMAAAAAWRTW